MKRMMMAALLAAAMVPEAAMAEEAPAAPADDAPVVIEAKTFMAGYADDLLTGDRAAIANRYDRRGAWRVGLRDYRTGRNFELVNETHTSRVEQYSTLRDNADRKVQSDEIVAKRVEGGVQKYLKEVSLYNQSFVKNDKLTVEQMLKAANTTVSGFTLYVVGEGIEKKVDDFAAEVAAQVAAATKQAA